MLALLGERGCAALVRPELGVAAATAATIGRQPSVAVVGQVGQQFARVQVVGDGALGDGDLERLAAPAVLVLALAVHAVVRSPVRVVAEGDERRDVAVGHEPHVAALAAVAAVGSAERDRTLAPERHAAGTAVATTYVQLGLVDESAHRNWSRLPAGHHTHSVPW